MRKLLSAIAIAVLAGVTPAQPSVANPAMQMWRLDCGTFDIDNLEGRGRVIMPVSCYLIRRGEELILFDAGLPAELLGKPQRKEGQTWILDRSLAEQFAQIGADPAKVTTLIVSHYHSDHHSQAGLFPNARLVIGAADAAALRGEPDQGALTPWLARRKPIEEISADRDLTGDGALTVLLTPGHTPGHLSMLVRLKSAAYLLTGDLVHMRSQLATGEPSGNHVDKVRGKAEIARMIALTARTKAQIIVGHEREDIPLLPAFPTPAR